MSLEAALAENTAALNQVAELLKEANAGRADAIERITASTGTAAGATRGRPAGSKKADPAPDPAPEPAAPPAETTAPKDETPAAPMSIERFREEAGVFLNVAEPGKTERKDFIKSINAHYGIEKVVQADPDNFAQIIGWFAQFAAGEKVSFGGDEDDIG